MKHTLLLGSKSFSRKMLLTEAQIPFITIEQDADEMQCDWTLPLEQAVAAIARHKMEHLLMPAGQEANIAFVLTADTLSTDAHGRLNGKAIDRADAIAKIRLNRNRKNHLATAFCLERKQFLAGSWQTQERIEQVVSSYYIFDVPDAWIDIYLEKSIALQASGAVAVELFGSQFLKEVQGSYSTIIGLPLFELREALEKIGFFN